MTFSEATRHHSRFRKLVENDRLWSGATTESGNVLDQDFSISWLTITDDTKALNQSLLRLRRVDSAIDAQKAYLRRARGPDARYRAEGNLVKLVIARNNLRKYVLALRSRNTLRH